MTAPCFMCGTARSCRHREVDPPRVVETPPHMAIGAAQPGGYANRKVDGRSYGLGRKAQMRGRATAEA